MLETGLGLDKFRPIRKQVSYRVVYDESSQGEGGP